ncbi:MAG TPA: hypothetical protein VHW44_23155 [Pseudonocardiaceae bacterium]|jgi:hypothetical protein|nr:hypothetical protein [Pseudonocardiaceae bacterium]
MDGTAPGLVTLYAFGSGTAVRVAEFRLAPDGRVALTVLDPDQARLAQGYYDHGVDFVAEDRLVRPQDGAAFMRALLQPFRMSYYRFVDESTPSAG